MEVNGYKIKPGADLTGANLSNADLRNADLGQNIHAAYPYEYEEEWPRSSSDQALDFFFERRERVRSEWIDRGGGATRLCGACLIGANLAGAILKFADLSATDLRDANLTGADLTNANLTDANLTGANFKNAILTGAKMPDGSIHG